MTARRETDLSWKLGLRGYAVFPTHLHDIRGSQHTEMGWGNGTRRTRQPPLQVDDRAFNGRRALVEGDE